MSRYKMRVAEKTEVMADLTYVQVSQMPQQQRMGNQINTLEEHVQLVNYVKSFNNINAIGAKVQLCTKWNLGLMQQLANSDSDREVITFLRYGWPLNHDGRATMITKFNHPTALRFPQQVQDYIKKEVSLNCLIGPFVTPPWMPAAVSPMSTRLKKDSNK